MKKKVKTHTNIKFIGAFVATAILAFAPLAETVSAAGNWTDWDNFQAQGVDSDSVYTGIQPYMDQGAMSPNFPDFDYTASTLVTITEEPADAVTVYPNEAHFFVGVDHPENVASYEWSYSGGGFSITPTTEESRSQGTPSFVVPSTFADTGPLWFRCVITDKEGGKVITRQAKLTIDNPLEQLPLVYVGDLVVRPGETLDLADYSYGSGTVSFSDDTTRVILASVQMNNPTMISDWRIAKTQGILLVNTQYYVNPYAPYDPSKYEGLPEEYHIEVRGENTIVSKHFDSVGSGNIFQAFFADRNNPDFMPNVSLEGDGKLNLDGGSFNYYSDATVDVGVDINGKSNDLTYTGDGFGMQAVGINVKEGTTLDFDVNSDALSVYSTGITSGDLIINGATINANSNPPAGGPMTGSAIISSNNNIVVTNSTLNLSGTVIAERFSPISQHKIHHFIGLSAGDSATIDDCDINIDMAVEKSDEGSFAANINGIRSGSDNGLLITNGSNIDVAIDAPEAVNVSGVYAATSATIDKSSNLNADISGIGENVYGVYAGDTLEITDANIDAVADGGPYTNPNDGVTYDNTIGVLGHPVSIDFTDDAHHVYAKTNRGAAFMASDPDNLPIDQQDVPSYNPAYTPSLTTLKNLAAVVAPIDAAISSYGYTRNGTELFIGETVYSLADTSSPAKEVLISSADVPAVPNTGTETQKSGDSAVEVSLPVAMIVAILSVISICYLRSRKAEK